MDEVSLSTRPTFQRMFCHFDPFFPCGATENRCPCGEPSGFELRSCGITLLEAQPRRSVPVPVSPTDVTGTDE